MLNLELPYKRTVLLLGTHPKELKTGIHSEICIPKHITALCTASKRREQPKGPPTDERINKM